MSTPSSADRNLLFGLLALKMDLVTREQLLDAMSAWLDRKTDPLGQVLQERSALAAGEREAVERLVEAHVARHGDARRSLAAVAVPDEVRDHLSRLTDDAVQDSLATVAPAAATLPLPGAPAPPAAGALRYRKVRPHAKGGLGEVFVAVDEELGREVALKEIQGPYADHGEHRGRFVREAEITGNLEHPSIVPVYGLGTQIDGRPYYAMRFIRGESMQEAITRFHQQDEGRRDPGERELALRGLLTRFVAVCQAVAYAHSRGVIHRDLKPANVMLGEYGETLVVDWGLAKALGQAEEATAAHRPVAPSAGGASATELGQVVGTPAFMPPEQACGDAAKVGPASDVFALGATLYALLTGQAPYAGAAALIQAAMAEWRPARRVNARAPAALEAVCARAMAARPEDRYATARALAGDVERWLADEPVGAYRDPVRERMRRWTKRNRTLVSGGVALLAAGVVGLTLGLGAVRAEKARTDEQLVRAETAEGVAKERLVQVGQERDRAVKAEGEANANLATARANLRRAEVNDRLARGNLQRAGENFALARKVVDDCFGIAKEHPLLKGDNLSPDLRQLKRLLLEKALPFYQELRARRPGDRGVEGDVWDQHMRVGYIQNELGSKPEALENYRLAEQAGRAVVKEQPGVPAYQADLALTLTNLGALQSDLGRPKEALSSYEESARLRRAVVKEQPGVPAYQAGLAFTLNNLGALQSDLGRPKEALSSYEESARLGRALVKAQPGVPEYQAQLADTLTNLGILQSDLGRPKEALSSYEESARLYRALAKAQPGVPEYQAGLALTLNNLGALQSDLGRPKEALSSYEESARLYRALAKAQPGVPEYQAGLARTLNNLGALQSDLGRPKEALSSYEESARLYRALVKEQPGAPAYQAGLANTLNNLGLLQRALGRPKEAQLSYEESARLRRALVKAQPGVPEYQADLANTLNNLGTLQSDLGRPKEALSSYEESARLYRALVKEQPGVPEYQDGLARTLTNLGALQGALGQPKEALASFDDASRLRRALVKEQPEIPEYRLDLCRPLIGQAMLLRRLRRPDEARRALDEALTTLAGLKRSHPAHPQVDFIRLSAYQERGRALAAAGRPRAALADFDRALALAPANARTSVRLARADALARAGEHGRAAAEAADLARLAPPASAVYDLACVLSLSAAGASRDAALPLPLRERNAEARARAAVALLHRAAKAGFFRPAASVAHLDKDADLAFLRNRADFRAFVAGLPKPSAP